MEPTNNEVGNAWTLYVLGQLSEAWPRRVDFNAMDLSTETGMAPVLDREVEETFDDLFRWLKSEGFIEYSQDGEGWVVDVNITTKAMDAIGHALPTAKNGAGAHLKKIAVGAGSTAGQAVIAETIGQVIGAAARSFAGGGA